MRDHPEIEQGDASVVGEEDVARMRIGVEKSIDEDLMEIGAEKFFGQPGAVQINACERIEFGNFPAGDVFHREHAAGGVIVDGLRDENTGKIAKGFSEAPEIRRLLPVIEFEEKRLAQLFDHETELVTPASLRMSVKHLGDFLHRFEIPGHVLPDARSLDLDRNGPAIAQLGAMHLSEGCRRHRGAFKFQERLGKSGANLDRDNRLDLADREWLDMILKAGERFHVSRRYEVRTRGNELAEFDESRAQLFQIGREFLRLWRDGRWRAVRQRIIDHGRNDMKFEAIAAPY